MSVNNHYLNRYNKFINYCRLNNTPKKETHHIVPRSMGGSDDSSNLIKLSLREHFIAHWLLFNSYRNESMTSAFMLMNNRQNKRVNSKTYAILKEHATAQSSQRWQDPEWSSKQRQILSLIAQTPIEHARRSQNAKKTNIKYKKESSDRMSNLWANPEKAQQMKYAMRRTKSTAESKLKHSDANKKKWADLEYKTRLKISLKESAKTKIKPVNIDGIIYPNASVAGEKFNISCELVRYRIGSKSKKFANWNYA